VRETLGHCQYRVKQNRTIRISRFEYRGDEENRDDATAAVIGLSALWWLSRRQAVRAKSGRRELRRHPGGRAQPFPSGREPRVCQSFQGQRWPADHARSWAMYDSPPAKLASQGDSWLPPNPSTFGPGEAWLLRCRRMSQAPGWLSRGPQTDYRREQKRA